MALPSFSPHFLKELPVFLVLHGFLGSLEIKGMAYTKVTGQGCPEEKKENSPLPPRLPDP
jgi:hypothetical protein